MKPQKGGNFLNFLSGAVPNVLPLGLTLKDAAQLGMGRQQGRGFVKDLLQHGKKQAIMAGVKIGRDVVGKRKNIRNALLTHGLNAAKNTGLFAFNRGVALPFRKKKKGQTGQGRRRRKRRKQTGRGRVLLARGGPKRKRKKQGGIPKRKRHLDVFD